MYSQGKEIQIHWSDFSLEWCACNNKEIEIFKQETSGWVKVQKQLYGFGGSACVNGKIISLQMPMSCDVVSCGLPKLNFRNGDFTWNSKIYEKKGTVESCLDPFNNKTINISMQNYDLKDAPSGKYKIAFGNADKIIEIK